LIHLPAASEGLESEYPHTPLFFSLNSLRYCFTERAPDPVHWLAFLKDIWPEDPQAIEALQEFFGYCLLPDTTQQNILMIVSPKRSGKGTITRVLRGLVGTENTAGPTLGSLGMNFGLWPLLGKSVAVISDARLSGRTDAAIVTERLLSISGEDDQTVDRKNMRPVTTRLTCRFVILTNELPRLNDPSGALAGRLVLLRMTRSWYGKENTRLTDELLKELPGILLWSIAGMRRLRDRGHFVQPEKSVALVEEMENLASPVGEFVRECCDVGPAYEVFVRDLFERWEIWCKEKGRKEAGTEAIFGRDLRAFLPALDMRQHRFAGKRLRMYVGLRVQSSIGDMG
jgi:putative DNA primase/helicase